MFVSCLLAVFLLTVRTRNRLANVLFGVFILLNAVDISSWFSNQFLLRYPTVLVFKATTGAIINPVFYLYALALCYSDFRLRARHLLHLTPFVLVNLVLMPRFYLADAAAQSSFLAHFGSTPEATFMLVLGHLQFVSYTVAVFLTLRKYRRAYRENYADTSIITHDWLFQLTVTLTVLHAIVVLKNALGFTPYSHLFNGFELLVGINATCILSWFVLKALYNPGLFRSIDSTIAPVEDLQAEKAPAAPAAPAQASPKIEAQLSRLQAHMAQAEPYLDPELTIQDLANHLNLPVRELSLLINHHLGQHFFDFVNEYRIQKAKRLLKDDSRKNLTVLEILYAVGFNSKSSFNTSFKKHTGLTPTQYRSA
ncbi:helix-turn-helix domain-containing protein [Hymenobacter arizonensis]|uniref:helix-turn-helix domain-containing protein n=1 Tax=Hymenobacter arizonensis TaxID=1227077 RepID=UPI001BE079CD|nr:helix-turn-helix transcriptional regulator [Hymenobacter arizonensis]